MSRDSLTLISYTVLVLVGRGGAGPHDLVRMMRQGRIYHAAAESQYYAEPKRLERLGLLRSRKEPGRTRERTIYELTDAGVEALRAWMDEPAGLPRVSGEPIVRMLATDLVGEGSVRESLLAMRAEIEELRAELDAGIERARTLPHRETYLRLNHELALRILDAYDGWLDDVARRLKKQR